MATPKFPPPNVLAPSELLLITDALASPADYLLYQLVAQHLKGGTHHPARCLVLSSQPNLTRWKAVGARLGLNVSNMVESGHLTFVPLQSSTSPHLVDETALSAALERVRSLSDTHKSSGSLLIVLEDVTTLEWLGISARQISKFVRALYSTARQTNAALVIRHHLLSNEEPDDLLRHLLALTSHHIEVRPLSSGRSGAVSGELALHVGPNSSKSDVKPISRSCALLYRLTDTGAVYFEKGTSGVVL